MAAICSGIAQGDAVVVEVEQGAENDSHQRELISDKD